MNRNLFLCGDRGSGKSITLLALLLRYILSRAGACLLLDPPGTIIHGLEEGRAPPQIITGLLAHLIAAGLESKVFVDYADPAKAMGRYLQFQFLKKSLALDILTRMNEEEINLADLLTAIFGLRGEKDGTNKPYTDKYAKLALRVITSIPDPPPINLIERLFILDDSIGSWMLDHTTDRDAANQFRAVAQRSRRDPKQWEIETGAAGRLLAILSSPAIFAHEGNTFSFREMILNQWVLLVDLSGVSKPVKRALGIILSTGAADANQALFEQTHREHGLLIGIDEFGANRFDTPRFLDSMREDRKYGTSYAIATQTLHDLPTDVLEPIIGLADKMWHNMSSGVDRAAADICDKKYDRNAIDQVRERAMHDGYEKIETVTNIDNHSQNIRDHKIAGKNDGHSTSRGVQYRAKMKVVQDITKKLYNPQRDEIKSDLTNFDTGEWFLRGKDRCEQGRTQMPGPAFEFQNGFVVPNPSGKSLYNPQGRPLEGKELFLPNEVVTRYAYKLRTALARIRQRPQFQAPRLWTNNNDSPNPSAPAATPTPPTGSAPGGMLGS